VSETVLMLMLMQSGTSELEGGHRAELEETISSLSESLADKQSTIDTLQLQVMIYREDFQSEREDRERAQSQITDLQAHINQLIGLQSRRPPATQVHRHSVQQSLSRHLIKQSFSSA